jgi:NAD(P)-dependent dehydrogenase (short-subunit alcohol dehydrogenase family)
MTDINEIIGRAVAAIVDRGDATGSLSVTGSDEDVGAAVVKALAEAGYEIVTAVPRAAPYPFESHAESVAKYGDPKPKRESDVIKFRRPIGWLHTLRMEGGQKQEVLSKSNANPFGKAGVDYSDSYEVTCEALMKVPLA